MKKFTSIYLMIIIGIFISLNVGLSAQNSELSPNKLQTQNQIESNYMQIHDQFKQQLDPLYFESNNNQDNLLRNVVFMLDTVYNYSISANPKRYIYTYSQEGYRLSLLLGAYENGEWIPATKEEYTYDIYGNRLTTIWETWEEGNWIMAR